jgi:CRISPR-associated protein Cmr6
VDAALQEEKWGTKIVPADHEYVPLMFQAQVGGRAQIQRLIPSQREKQQAYDWARQWQEACDKREVPTFENHVQTYECQFTWRMVTNSGQDAGVIRPVIGDRGWAYFPGSSMKGAFLRACRQICTPDEVRRFCGGQDEAGDLHPGILRFHGGYPKDAKWLNNSLVDVVHPQEDWQIKNQGSHSAVIQISLFQPKFVFGISSTVALTEVEWQTVGQGVAGRFEQGIGSRVSAGYGQIATHTGNKLVAFGLSGQGQTSKLINGQGEFRSNLFKAALRGHTRRLFCGITDERSADALTKLLWGGIGTRQIRYCWNARISFNAPDLELDEWVGDNRNNRVSVYETGDATLDILLMQSNLTSDQQNELKAFTIRLVKFAMLLGGFGKAWRRADHRLFLPDYRRQMIGCHWEFSSRSRKLYIPLAEDLKGVTRF